MKRTRVRIRLRSLLAAALMFGLGAPLMLPVQAAAPAEVSGVAVRQVGNWLQVLVTASKAVTYKVTTATTPRRSVIVDMTPAVAGAQLMSSYDVNQSVVERVRVNQQTPATLRITIDLVAPAPYKASAAPDRKGVLISFDMTGGAASKTQAPPAVATAVPAAAPSAAPSPAASKPAGPAVAKKPAAVPSPKPSPVATAMPAVKPAVKPVPVAVAPQPRPRPGMVVPVAVGTPIAYPTAIPTPRPARTKAVVTVKEQLVSLDFVNADLVYVMKLLAKQSNMNIITDPSVQGTVTMTLNNVPLRTAMSLILQTAGFDFKQLGNIIIVGPPAALDKLTAESIGQQAPSPTEEEATGPTQIIPLEYANAESLAPLVAKTFPAARITTSTELNALVVKAPVAVIKQVKELVAKLDRKKAEPKTVTEVIRLNYAVAKDVQKQLAAFVPEASKAANVDERLNAFVITADEAVVNKLKDFLASVDTPLRQVMLELKVIQVSDEGNKTIGAGTTPLLSSTNTTFTEGTPPAANPFQFGVWNRSPIALAETLNFLLTKKDTRLLASPSILATNGKDADINIGDHLALTYTDLLSGLPAAVYVDAAIDLKVKPIITPDGRIVMNLTPSVKEGHRTTDTTAAITDRTISVTVEVKDGETIFIGGMLTTNDAKGVTKVPLLGDLPIFGNFFKGTLAKRISTDTIILITARIVTQ